MDCKTCGRTPDLCLHSHLGCFPSPGPWASAGLSRSGWAVNVSRVQHWQGTDSTELSFRRCNPQHENTRGAHGYGQGGRHSGIVLEGRGGDERQETTANSLAPRQEAGWGNCVVWRREPQPDSLHRTGPSPLGYTNSGIVFPYGRAAVRKSEKKQDPALSCAHVPRILPQPTSLRATRARRHRENSSLKWEWRGFVHSNP